MILEWIQSQMMVVSSKSFDFDPITHASGEITSVIILPSDSRLYSNGMLSSYSKTIFNNSRGISESNLLFSLLYRHRSRGNFRSFIQSREGYKRFDPLSSATNGFTLFIFQITQYATLLFSSPF